MNKRCLKEVSLCVILMAVGPGAQLLAQTASAQGESKPAYLDPSKPVEQRVDDLVSRMTLEEKASQLVNQARAIPRLGIPKYDWRSEALHGVAGIRVATVFPEPVGLAATFDPPLIHDMAAAIGAEGRAKFNIAVREGRREILEGLDFWAPNINIARDPRWGRGQETYGEDPFLTARMAVAYVTGMQGNDPKYFQAIATPKHFAVHSGPEPTRHVRNVRVSKHDLEDTYLPAFRAAVMEGKAGSIMCAYNRVNDEPACANTFLLENRLRGAWRFDGYVVGDCDSVEEIYSAHHYVETIPMSAALAVKRGLDNECIDGYSEITDKSDYQRFLDAVSQGLLTEQDIDRSVKRLFGARFRLGLFDPPDMVPYAQIPDSVVDSKEHREIALETARESMVLLKNNGILPLRAGLKRIAVVGPSAESRKVLLGNYSGTPSRVVTALDGIKEMVPGVQVTFVPGMNLLREDRVVPAEVFSTAEGKPGLDAEYFANKQFKGEPQTRRVDRFINLEAPPAGPHSLAQPPGPNEFSVRWSGFLTPAETASYQLTPTASSNRLWLDGKLVLDTTETGAARAKTVDLEKGRRYAIKLESVSQDDGGATLRWLPLIPKPLDDALASAKEADVVIAVVGISSQLEGEELLVSLPGFAGGDRTGLDLPEEEEELLAALKQTGKPLVVVLMNGSALGVKWADKNADAILEAWYAGEEGGTAIAETLTGTNNPGGRLPVTFYKSVDQLPAFEDYSMKGRTYRYFSGEPLYPFGYGLSYSKFSYTRLKMSSTSLKPGESLQVEADVTNESNSEGDEVVQLYLAFPDKAGAPLRALRGFRRIHVLPHGLQHVVFALRLHDLSMVDEAGKQIVASGTYRVSVGGGQPGTSAPVVKGEFAVQNEQVLPDE